jgi:hypothetical protein
LPGVGDASTFSKPMARRRSTMNSAVARVSGSFSESVPMLGSRSSSK